MNNVDEIHQLLDGELGDDHMAELLHRLSVDPEKRLMFRQQIILQNALHHNETFDGLGVSDDWTVLEGIASDVGFDKPVPVRRGLSTLAMFGLLLVGLIIGGGAGYISGRAAAEEIAAARPNDTVKIVEQVPVPITRPNFALDELAFSIGTEGLAVMTPAPETPASRRATPRYRGGRRTAGGGNDLTGAPEARKLERQRNGDK